jgi:hypothetical protein
LTILGTFFALLTGLSWDYDPIVPEKDAGDIPAFKTGKYSHFVPLICFFSLFGHFFDPFGNLQVLLSPHSPLYQFLIHLPPLFDPLCHSHFAFLLFLDAFFSFLGAFLTLLGTSKCSSYSNQHPTKSLSIFHHSLTLFSPLFPFLGAFLTFLGISFVILTGLSWDYDPLMPGKDGGDIPALKTGEYLSLDT